MAFLTELPLPEASRLAAVFGLKLSEAEPLALGSVNSNFCLRTADGRRYFARIYEEQPMVGAEAEVHLLTTLETRGVKVATPLVADDGRRVLEYRKKPFAIFPWVAGEWLCLARVTADRCRAVGAALARVHLASEAVGSLPLGRFRPADMLARLAQVEAAGPGRLSPEISRIRGLYAEYTGRRDPSLPHGVCHGDLFRDNVLWQNGEIAALLDFESAAWGSFAYDLMVTALAWCYRDSVVVEHARALLDGYSSLRDLTASERAAIEVEGALACLRFATSRITDFELRTPPGSVPARDFRRFLQRLEAIEQGAFATAWKQLW